MEDIRYLRSFMCVAEYLNFTKAADHLYMSQSTLSKHIAELEEQLGVQLFSRTHHLVCLTPPGATLFEESRSIMDRLDEVFEKTRQSQNKVRGTLRIGCLGNEHSFLPKVFKHFSALYPHVTLDIQIMPGALMLNEALDHQKLDLAFSPFIGNVLTSRFEVREVLRARLCFLLPKNHLYANKYSLELSALKQERFIFVSRSTFPNGIDWFMQQCNLRGFTPNIVSQPSNFETLFWQVTAGKGIAIFCFDSVFCRMMKNNIAFVAMNGANAYGHIGLLWKNGNHNPIIPLFVEQLARYSPAQCKFDST
ncbi:MAG TPA: LysR family transcriptional regulator [Negativicutes bacterium]